MKRYYAVGWRGRTVAMSRVDRVRGTRWRKTRGSGRPDFWALAKNPKPTDGRSARDNDEYQQRLGPERYDTSIITIIIRYRVPRTATGAGPKDATTSDYTWRGPTGSRVQRDGYHGTVVVGERLPARARESVLFAYRMRLFHCRAGGQPSFARRVFGDRRRDGRRSPPPSTPHPSRWAARAQKTQR